MTDLLERHEMKTQADETQVMTQATNIGADRTTPFTRIEISTGFAALSAGAALMILTSGILFVAGFAVSITTVAVMAWRAAATLAKQR